MIEAKGMALQKPRDTAKRKPKNHSRRNKTRTHRAIIKELDAIARREVVEERDGNRCVRCGRTEPEVQIQWSHVHSRRHHCIRWDPDNSKALCSACHTWWTYNPGLAYDWFIKNFRERWERITRILQINPKVNVKKLLADRRG